MHINYWHAAQLEQGVMRRPHPTSPGCPVQQVNRFSRWGQVGVRLVNRAALCCTLEVRTKQRTGEYGIRIFSIIKALNVIVLFLFHFSFFIFQFFICLSYFSLLSVLPPLPPKPQFDSVIHAGNTVCRRPIDLIIWAAQAHFVLSSGWQPSNRRL